MLPPGSGTGQIIANAPKIIRFVRHGCTNRPFYHIVVAERRDEQFMPVIEQLGAYDPFPNDKNEKLVSLNFERIKHWIGNGADLSTSVAQVLGLSGFLPVHPTSYMQAWRNRQARDEAEKKATLEKQSSNSENTN